METPTYSSWKEEMVPNWGPLFLNEKGECYNVHLRKANGWTYVWLYQLIYLKSNWPNIWEDASRLGKKNMKEKR